MKLENKPDEGGRAPRIALLACSVFEREIALYGSDADHIIETRFFEMGLHDNPDHLRATLQTALGELDVRNDIEAVALAYGLCGRGTAELHPLRHRLVIPRAHDCITIFLGSKERYAAHQKACPSCYYYTLESRMPRAGTGENRGVAEGARFEVRRGGRGIFARDRT